MAITTHRIIIIFLLISLLSGGFEYGRRTRDGMGNSLEIFELDYDESYQKSDSLKTEESIYGNGRAQNGNIDAPSVGSVIKTGIIIIASLWSAINPVSINPLQYSSDGDVFSILLATIVMVFRILLTSFVAMEVYSVFINRKAP